MPPRFSLIIPAYNEEIYLPRLLASVREAADRFDGDSIEVIVADNCSNDRTAAVALEYGAKVVSVEKRCIAAVRNGGAAVATGDVLCFVDADSAIHPNTFCAIQETITNPRVLGGATGVKLERLSLGLFVVCCAMYPMLWLTRFDTGVVFCEKEDFALAGGYDEELLLAEDVSFLVALTRLGWRTGRRLKRPGGVRALGCTRKFDEHGDWHYFILFGHVIRNVWKNGVWSALNPRNSPVVARYWYDPSR